MHSILCIIIVEIKSTECNNSCRKLRIRWIDFTLKNCLTKFCYVFSSNDHLARIE